MDRRTVSATARRALGFELRPDQLDGAVSAAAGRDTVVVLPTGAGKTAIYQAAGLAGASPVVIVSPLLALQREQHQRLDDLDLGTTAVLNSDLETKVRDEVLAAARAGSLQWLLLAPEQLASGEVREAVTSLGPRLLVVDEAHCVSAWGNDFRPAYLGLGRWRRELGDPTTLALTATAGPLVRDEIVELLGLRDPEVVISGVERPNIELEVRRAPDDETAEAELSDRCATLEGKGIVYVARREDAERLAAVLGRRARPALAYHGGLDAGRRSAVQDRFTDADPSVVVATTAFGLGVDVPDVRFVLHAGPPETPDAWYQELGRAGRDGGPAFAGLFHAVGSSGQRAFTGGPSAVGADRVRAVLGAATEGAGVVELGERTDLGAGQVGQAIAILDRLELLRVEGDVVVRTPRPPAGAMELIDEVCERRHAVQRSQRDHMQQLLEQDSCRWRSLLAYFGEPGTEACGRCDVCHRGGARQGAAAPAAVSGPAAGSRIRHAAWGGGTVLEREGDRMLVAFERAGYRTLSWKVVEEENLVEVE